MRVLFRSGTAAFAVALVCCVVLGEAVAGAGREWLWGIGVALSLVAIVAGVSAPAGEAGRPRLWTAIGCCVLLFSVSTPLGRTPISIDATNAERALHTVHALMLMLGWPLAVFVAIPVLRAVAAAGTSRDVTSALLSTTPVVTMIVGLGLAVTLLSASQALPDAITLALAVPAMCGLVIGLDQVNGWAALHRVRMLSGPPPPALVTALDAVRDQTGVTFDDVRLWDADRLRCAVHQLLWRPNTLVVSRGLVREATDAELFAALCHEAGHVSERHFSRSIGWRCAALTIMVVAIGLVAESPYQRWVVAIDPRLSIVAPLLASLGVAFSMQAVRRRFEFEADAFAVRVAGAEPLASVLRKIGADLQSRMPGGRLLIETEKRVARFSRTAA